MYVGALALGVGFATALLGAPSSVGTTLGSPTPAPVTVAPSATASPPAAVTASPTPAPTPTPSPTPTPCPAGDLGCIARPLVQSWVPDGATAIVEQRSAGGSTIVAVPLAGGAPTPLVQLRANEWAISPHGVSVAFAVHSADGSSRLGAIDLASMKSSWLLPDEAGVAQLSPVWALNDRVVYFTKASAANQIVDLGVFSVRSDGTNLLQRRDRTDRTALPTGITPDGVGIVLSLVAEGSPDAILDLNTGRTGPFAPGGVASWRLLRPRALTICCGPAGGPTQISTWDDQNPSVSRAIVERERVFGASWDPTGTRIVAALGTGGVAATVPPSLVLMDPAGGGRTTVTGTEGAARPQWTSAGVVYQGGIAGTLARELRVVAPPSGQTRTLFTASGDILRWTVIEP